MKKTMATSLVLTTIAVVGAGCGSNGEGGKEATPAAASVEASGAPSASAGTEKVELTFYYPIQVGGPLTATIESMAEQFTKENPNIVVKPVYTGSYGDTTLKTQAAVAGGNSPDVAVLLAADLFSFMDMDSIVPLDEFIAQDGDDGFLDDFYPAFLENSQVEGKTYSLPFQRSTVVLYYNKDAFKEVGLDPEQPPATWDELAKSAKQLTNEDRWGIEIPSSAPTSATWMFSGFAIQNGKNLMSQDGKEVYFDTPENEEALQFWVDLSKKDKAMPENVIEWATTPSDFLEQKTAMMFHTTGNLANIRQNAKFDFGVAMLPQNKQFGSPTGGGNLYIFKDIGKERQEAAWKFVKFMTDPERAAQWSIDTGYVGVRKSSYETEAMKQYTEQFPAALVARDQLAYAKGELSTHNNGKVTAALNDAIQAALYGKVTPAEALKGAQTEADKALASFK
ncbi:ABC transporter substrate-binding protein [Cohnella fermenti]|uniref:Extracellular solute-binding protein n=1 Tax=Cohnella fermenti TaxID=2565925 RepID=A0A4S4BL59_9BACL|nr:ABC transporter substrate-binding protein [Cohnella fermenti]THF75492.1 extracellular solute-binding protein [Cohnella fermenti]